MDFACQEDTNLENFSQNILYLCVEHYFGTENFLRKYGTSYCWAINFHLNWPDAMKFYSMCGYQLILLYVFLICWIVMLMPKVFCKLQQS